MTLWNTSGIQVGGLLFSGLLRNGLLLCIPAFLRLLRLLIHGFIFRRVDGNGHSRAQG